MAAILFIVAGALTIALGFVPPVDGSSIACFVSGGISIGTGLMSVRP
jgi:hypothetical protein